MSLDRLDVIAFLCGIYEHSPWVAEALVEDKTMGRISTVSDLAARMKKIVDGASDTQKMALLNAHPDLCEKLEKLKELTEDSQTEQSRAGLQSMVGDELEKFKKLNLDYRSKFGFPFILAVRNATKQTVLSALEGRLSNNSQQQEFFVALQQVHKIAWMRLLSKINTEDAGGFLTCHVLDTANGIPGRFSSGHGEIQCRIIACTCWLIALSSLSRNFFQHGSCKNENCANPTVARRVRWRCW